MMWLIFCFTRHLLAVMTQDNYNLHRIEISSQPHGYSMHPEQVLRLQDAFDCILQQQFAESLSADGYGRCEATNPHSRYRRIWIFSRAGRAQE